MWDRTWHQDVTIAWCSGGSAFESWLGVAAVITYVSPSVDSSVKLTSEGP